MIRNNKGKITIISRESDNRTLDIAMLEAELLRRGMNVRVLSRLLTKDKSLKMLGYAGHVLKQEAAILDSDVVVLDTYCIPASMLPHRKGTKIVQMWHALGAVKKFGWQTVGKGGGSSERTARLMKMHHGYDHVISASDITAEYFCEAFRTNSSRIVKQGLPRIDYIKSVSSGDRKEDMRKKIFSAYPGLRSDYKKIVLYAPTFRRGKAVDIESLAKKIDSECNTLVVKLHPLYRGDAEAVDGVIYDETFSSYDWLSAADAVISDYSSFVIEAALADKPLYLYTYDLEEYAEDTGLNMEFGKEPISKYVFIDAAELAKQLDKEYDFDALRRFRERYIDIDTGGTDSNYCTAKLADFIESMIE